MTITDKVLLALRNSRNGLNARQIGIFIGHDNQEALHSNLCRMVSKGYVKKDGSHVCECCGSKSYSYRITDEGRVKIGYAYNN